MDNILFGYYTSNVGSLLERYLGNILNYSSRVNSSSVIIMCACNNIGMVIDLKIKDINKYDLYISTYSALNSRGVNVSNKDLESCLEFLEKELKRLNKGR